MVSFRSAATLLHELAKGLLGLTAGDLREQSSEKPRFLALLDFLKNLRQLGVINALFQASEKGKQLGRGLLVEPREKAVERLLQRLLRP